jgi:hypothetical protein
MLPVAAQVFVAGLKISAELKYVLALERPPQARTRLLVPLP